jgi:hypothetical protein
MRSGSGGLLNAAAVPKEGFRFTSLRNAEPICTFRLRKYYGFLEEEQRVFSDGMYQSILMFKIHSRNPGDCPCFTASTLRLSVLRLASLVFDKFPLTHQTTTSGYNVLYCPRLISICSIQILPYTKIIHLHICTDHSVARRASLIGP